MAHTEQRAPVRRWGAGTGHIVRLLVAADEPMTQVALAAAAGVTQPRASQVLKQLIDRGAAVSRPAGYVGRRARLFDLYRERMKPSLFDAEAAWYSTKTLMEQARRIANVAKEHGAKVALSADLAPDLLVPWRHPTMAIVYTNASLPLDRVGFVPAEGRADATVLLRHTRDTSLLAPCVRWPRVMKRLPLTDPVQQWFDLLDLGGEDRVEAADRLRRAIVDRTIDVSR
ncbi:MAG TPA: helix-turn-helix domain-containing protein [Acidimicrobiia bacterium]|nr:helix-turn-helix domain-containing protein [Acidimicrobiia bacterium]